MVRLLGKYLGELRTAVWHEPSGASIITDAPVDNHGKGENFSPTDLLAAALGSCMATVMGIYAQQHHIDLTDMHWQVEKIMGGPPRHIATLRIHMHMPAHIPADIRKKLEHIAHNCPVALSLSSQLRQEVQFSYEL